MVNIISGLAKAGIRHQSHKLEIAGSNPARTTKMRIIKLVCIKCKKECNHIIQKTVCPWGDIFTECIYENGKLRWAGAKIAQYSYNEYDVVCSNCGFEYKHESKKSFYYVNDKLINFLKEQGNFILSKENKEIFKDY